MDTADQQLDATVNIVQQNRALQSKVEMDARFVENAKSVVTNPTRYANRPLVRRIAWMTLMGVRGKRCDQTRLAQMQAGGCK